MMMSPFDPAASPSAESDRSRSLLHRPRRREKQWRKSSATMGPVVLALLPVVLSLIYLARALYCCPTGVHPSGDAQLYVYQLTRIGEVNGRWWELGTDPLVGHPYQSSAAKMPGIYEGLDLLLLSMLTSRFVDPVLNYCLAVLAVLVVNGWIAGLLTYRLTRSYPWAVLAVVLITLNLSTALRVSGHLHLFKYGWILLSVWAFLRYLETPSLKRGIQLGLATVVVLQSSFYLGYLLALGLGLCWLLELIAGRITRRHASAAATAAATVALLGPLVTYPVWAVAPRAALSDSYFVRSIKDLWLYGADLVQYIFPYLAKTEIIFLKARYGGFFEGWNYLGVVALGTFALGALGWLRGRRLELRERRSVHLLLVLIGLFVLLSLSGGPSILLYQLFPSFRCYGRAGLLALALTCVATPAILQGLLARIRSDSRRRLLYLAVLGLASSTGGPSFTGFPSTTGASRVPPKSLGSPGWPVSPKRFAWSRSATSTRMRPGR